MKEKDEHKKAVVIPFDPARGTTRKLNYSVEREQAEKTAEQFLTNTDHSTFHIERVAAPNELTGRLPAVYGVEIDNNCWIAYLGPSEKAESAFFLMSSKIVIVSRTNGKVLYFGSANDEG